MVRLRCYNVSDAKDAMFKCTPNTPVFVRLYAATFAFPAVMASWRPVRVILW
jgi:hypothetical protein